MPTAIAIVLTDYGFGIAADRRHFDGTSRKLISDEVQKIFPIFLPNQSNAYLVYMLCGVTQVYGVRDNGERDLLFDLAVQVPEVIKELNENGEFPTLRRYVDALGSKLAARCVEATSLVKDSQSSSGYVLVAGYYKGSAGLLYPLEIIEKGKDSSFRIDPRDALVKNRVVGCFPKAINDRIADENDPVLLKHRLPEDFSHNDIGRATETARLIVDACCNDLEVRALAPEDCEAIGGGIHVAQITLGEGFKMWLDATPLA
jgi:hypothetical protein